mmetsp:Transcript_5573/g.15790  ORF Transcript_5573/g.15790 Transcript_5573/m.15790 type:complete len:229 (+) Transcript_5573:69-755(+)
MDSEQPQQKSTLDLDDPFGIGGLAGGFGENWEVIFEQEDATIKRKFNETNNVYRFYTKGILKGVTAKSLYDLNIDTTYRKTWDANCAKLEVIEEAKQSGGFLLETLFWSVSYPFPFSNREYVFQRKYKHDVENNFYAIDSKATENDKRPSKKASGVRVEVFESTLVVRELEGDPSSCEYISLYMENPGGSIPMWLFNWAISSAVPKGLDDLKRASTNYPAYLEKRKKK